jgi:hypothetical protein
MSSKPWSGPVAIVAFTLSTLVLFLLALAGIVALMPDSDMRLTIAIVGAVASLFACVAFVVIALASLNLSDPKQALGLPDGSVRALIALTLIVIFAVMLVYFFSNLDVDSKAPQNEFAKQALTILGTLITSISSFYFGSKSTLSAVTSTSGLTTTGGGPSIASISPSGAPAGTNPQTITINGSNLSGVGGVQLQSGASTIVGTVVSKTDTSISGTFDLTGAAQVAWDVVLTVGGTPAASKAGAFTVS